MDFYIKTNLNKKFDKRSINIFKYKVKRVPKKQKTNFYKINVLQTKNINITTDYLENLIITKKVLFDGQCCTGKTFLTNNKKSIKISNYINDNDRNFYSPTSLLYYEGYKSLINNNNNFIGDRSPISNIAFLLITQLQNFLLKSYKNETFINKITAYGFLTLYLQSTNLIYLLRECKSHNFNVIILVDSNFKEWQKRLRMRAEETKNVMDLYASKQNIPLYGITQFIVYSYIGELLNYPVIDLNKLELPFEEFMTIIKNKLEIIDDDDKINFKKKNNYNITLEDYIKMLFYSKR